MKSKICDSDITLLGRIIIGAMIIGVIAPFITFCTPSISTPVIKEIITLLGVIICIFFILFGIGVVVGLMCLIINLFYWIITGNIINFFDILESIGARTKYIYLWLFGDWRKEEKKDLKGKK